MPSERVRRFVLPCDNRRNCKAIRSRTVFLAQFTDIGNGSVRREQTGLDTTANDEGNDLRRSEVDASDGSTVKKVAYRSLPVVPERCRATRVLRPSRGRTRPEAFVLQRPLRDGRAAAIVAGGGLIALAENASEMRRVVETVEERNL